MRISTTLKRAAALGAVTVALAAGVGGTANAAGRDGQDPISSGCAADAITARSVPLNADGIGQVGTLELRYSPSCRTVWARVYSRGGNLWANVVRQKDNQREGCNSSSWDSGAGQYYCYTAMVDDAGYKSYAVGNATDSSGQIGSHAGYTDSY
ncbi:DUF2690 domain-containing protein [Kitasatospora sp. NPDC094011]|uniref:DUF2690 domain-containing protein n=1 Tax=Kitasatospora sp. NPDC094011 TaxID=3364090 RepID=UPI003807D292